MKKEIKLFAAVNVFINVFINFINTLQEKKCSIKIKENQYKNLL